VIGPSNDLIGGDLYLPECMSLEVLNLTGNPIKTYTCPLAKRFLSTTLVIFFKNTTVDEWTVPKLKEVKKPDGNIAWVKQ
jgi:hypothetical protein